MPNNGIKGTLTALLRLWFNATLPQTNQLRSRPLCRRYVFPGSEPMKHWLTFNSYLYWVLMLGFSLMVLVGIVDLSIGNIGQHGELSKPVTPKQTLVTVAQILTFTLMALVSFYAGKQKLFPQLIVNIFLAVVLVFLGAPLWFYASFFVFLPPIGMILFQIYGPKT
ncbi:hypothetical protein [Agaribacterium sp. ZY112]|uniref:hypothetical protein n=1 Tax=Agaribacterium sp. ZY112 TaxID=3233574 RepID=UPI00352508EB